MTSSVDLESRARDVATAARGLSDLIDEHTELDPSLRRILEADLHVMAGEADRLNRIAGARPALGMLVPPTSRSDRLIAALAEPRDARLPGHFDGSFTRAPLFAGLVGGDPLGLAVAVRLTYADPADAAGKAADTVVRLMQAPDESGRRVPDSSVRIALFSLVDVIGMLARAALTHVPIEPSDVSIADLVDAIGRAIETGVAPAVQPGLDDMDVAALRADLELAFSGHVWLSALEAAGYWDRFARVAAHATAEGRRRFASLLWNGLADFDAAYAALSGAIEGTGYASEVFVAADALRASDDNWNGSRRSPLAAATVLALASGDTETFAVRTRFGPTQQIAPAVLAVLAREIRLTVEANRTSALARTDLVILPFVSPQVLPRDGHESGLLARNPPWLAEALLQAKSMHVFARAVATLDLAGVVVMVEPEFGLADGFSPILTKFVSTTHGRTTAEREGLETTLFVAAAADAEQAAPQEAMSLPAFGAFTRLFSGGDDWLQRWSGDLPFDNVFILGARRSADASTKSEAVASKGRALATRQTYAALSDSGLWLRHVRNTAVALDEAINAEDGGTGYLVQSIGGVDFERARRRHIAMRLDAMRQRLTSDARLLLRSGASRDADDTRTRAALSVQSRLRHIASTQRLGALIASLSADERELSWHFTRLLVETPSASDDGAPEARLASRFTREAIDAWLRRLRRLGAGATPTPLFADGGLTALTDELVVSAVRAGLGDRIAVAVARLLTDAVSIDAAAAPVVLAARAGSIAAELVNSHVAVLGFEEPWSQRHPRRRGTLGAPLFERPAFVGAEAIANAPATRLTLQYCSDCTEAVTMMVDENVAAARNGPDSFACDEWLRLLGEPRREGRS